jgi:regulator of protease activity HflC (stomatin/prohibitin superfamily)
MEYNNTSENNFDAGVSALFNAFRYLFAGLAVVIVLLIAWYFSFGGAFTVEQHERVLVMNFGKLEKDIYGPGWHWNWPYPVSEIIRVPGPENMQSITSESFWFYMQPGKEFSEMNFTNNSKLTPGKDGYLLTGDANIIHGVWQMDYQIKDAAVYYKKCLVPDNPSDDDQVLTHPDTGLVLGTRGPKTLLQATLENTIIKVSAVKTVDYAWKDPDFIAKIQSEVKAAVNKLGIGVEVIRVVSLQRTTPPMGALNAFRAVTQAQIKSAEEKHKAQNYAVQQKNEAESGSAKLIADANSYAIEVVESIKSDAKTFKAILKEYRSNPDTVPVALYSDTLSDVLTSAEDIFILRANSNGNQEIRILLNREPEKK